ncbi:16S rRNA (uracil(1498)-N(3))-methyltransferase [Thiolapillus brandeum]|uniref:Ribosomal RNA small subunit methyltransferase E n=1 Tax=Thiolapillus brandeum TaxID=1076588 RepID=A0A7U6JKV5_9GAMM|nr:16S rRNA (uracil(1498)-N(3))-methyltransferase [Thiolapillus brandeum]BAO45490.1 ribosomal RNA small subunit methyltransferase E [Thiolapillus brandeum]
MRRPRSYLPLKVEPGSLVELPAGIVRHLVQVLRMQAGQEIVLFNGEDGIDYRAVLTEADRRRARARILSAGNPEPTPKLQIHLALGLSRGERMDLALQKAVELGAASIAPLITDRVQRKLSPERLEKRIRHWRKIIISACEQSGRCRLPRLHQPQTLTDWLRDPPEKPLLLDPAAQYCLKELPPPDNELGLLIGPEGGFSDQERELALQAGCTGVRLGPRVLRTETAPLAAIAAIQALWGDFC